MNVSKKFIEFRLGDLVDAGGRKFRITHFLSIDSLLGLDDQTGETCRLRIEQLKPWVACAEPSSPGAVDTEPPGRDLLQYTPEEWAIAQHRLETIKPLLENPMRRRADVEMQAEDCGYSVASLYSWLHTFLESGHVSSLVPCKRGRRPGTRLLGEHQEAIIQSAIDDIYLQAQKPSVAAVIEEVDRRSRKAGVPAPHANTVRRRIARLDPVDTLRRRGRAEKARNMYKPVKSEFPGADFPLAVVQIDHTQADVILVDEVHRKPLARPWITLAIDVCSRVVVGTYFSFEDPSSTAVAMCLSQAICPKRDYLASIGVGGSWPVWGVMSVVHSDNGADFRSGVLDRACEEYKIDLQFRPRGSPHFGGHIERLMGTMAIRLKRLPGATFSNPKERENYDSDKNAVFTLKEFEKYIIDMIVNDYHQRSHAGLMGASPMRRWNLGILGDEDTPGRGSLPIPEDPLRVQLDFMPFEMRTVQRYGLLLDHIFYYDAVLDPYINSTDSEDERRKRKFLVRYDPRNISMVYFLDPADGRYVPIPYRNRGWPAISMWEKNEAIARLRKSNRKDIDENAIFETIERLRQQVEDATHRTRSARRKQARNPQLNTARGMPGHASAPAPAPAAKTTVRAPAAPARAPANLEPTAAVVQTLPVPFAEGLDDEVITPFDDFQ